MIAESVELVVAAMGAGVAAGMSDSVSDAAKKAYEKVTLHVAKLVGRDPDEVRQQFAEPEAAQKDLVAALEAAEDDAELVDAARSLLRLMGKVDQRGKFVIHAHDNKGMQVGDNNTMTLNFGE
ncbi:hypothetical protein [Actinophytocola sp.]|uniref:hypothetical protein n=1 Tax=Actinophytocola sp. TaxID=1872138 RepID=UPI00389A6CD0